MDPNSPFCRSSRVERSPPHTPTTPSAAPRQPPDAPQSSRPAAVCGDLIATSELQNWMTGIDQCLNEICAITETGKLNSEQKLKVSTLCRRVGHGTSQMVTLYQSVKSRAMTLNIENQALKEKMDLSERLQSLTKSIDETSKPSLGNSSFADMVKRGNNFIKPINISSVAIYPQDNLKSSEETKTLVQKIISPEEMKLQVRGLRKTKNGGVIISTETRGDIEKLKQSVQLTNSGLLVDEPQKRKPRVVIIGVPSSMQEKDVFICLYKQNIAESLPELTLDKYLSSIKLSHKSGKKDIETCNYVIEVPAAIRKALITKERVFVNWSSCPVRDFTLVTRCYKCQQYGHAAKSCREASNICGHCCSQGHTVKECTKKTEEPKCATCLHFKKPGNHVTGSADCPAKIAAEKRYINSIDYEGA